MSLVTDALQRLSKAVRIAPALATVEVTLVDEGDWRVTLPGAADNPFALLGLVSLSEEGRYQVVSVSQPLADIEADTLDDAVEALRPRVSDVPALLAGIRV